MTKAEIKKIQALDAALFLEFQQYEDWFGEADTTTRNSAMAWVQTRQIMEMLNIELDVTLADFQKAFKIERRLKASKTKTNTNTIEI